MAALKRQALAAAPRPSNESLTSANSEVNVPTTVSESNTGDKKTTPAPASSSSSSAEGVTNGVQASTDSKDDKMADAEESEAEKKTGEGTSNDDEMKVDDPAEDGVKQQQQDGSASSEDISKENPPPASNQEERRSSTVPQTPTGVSVRRQPWEYVDEVMALLKTAFPLLALSMETMCDQIINKLKPTTDEDVYRLIVALLNDGVIVRHYTGGVHNMTIFHTHSLIHALSLSFSQSN